jgi:hypothetical protein
MLTQIHEDEAFELSCGLSTEDFKFVKSEFLDKSRWSSYFMVVFETEDGDLYGFDYEDAATEYQEVEREEFTEVYPVTARATVEYVKRKRA